MAAGEAYLLKKNQVLARSDVRRIGHILEESFEKRGGGRAGTKTR